MKACWLIWKRVWSTIELRILIDPKLIIRQNPLSLWRHTGWIIKLVTLILNRLPISHLIHIGLLHYSSSQLNLLLKISIQFLLVNRAGHQGLRNRRWLAADATLLTHVAARTLWPNVHWLTLTMILILRTLKMGIGR